MVSEPSLDLRKKRILGAVVREHVMSAEPVGSRVLVEDYELGAASATIRSEMSALEELGYLEQPHTSAGRVPTERGYRLYVDSLMADSTLLGHEEEDVRLRLDYLDSQVEELVSDTSKILSRLTKLMAIVTAQTGPSRTVKRVDLVPLDSKRVLVVVVTSDGEVDNQMIVSRIDISPMEVKAVEAEISARFVDRGGPMMSAAAKTIQAELTLLFRSESLGRLASEAAAAVLDSLFRGRDALAVDGANNMLDQPEFSQADGVRNIFGIIEERSMVSDLIKDILVTQQVVVKIGSEIATISAQCSFVGASYKLPSGGVGVLGILGPTRMNYDRAVAAVSCVAREISTLI